MSKVITCVPIVVGNGCKYITTNLAHYTKNLKPDSKVALIDFDLENPYLALKLSYGDNIHCIDNLLEKIESNIFDEKILKENMIILKNGVELLKGINSVKPSSIKINHIENILNVLKENYDYIFIALSNNLNSTFAHTIFSSDDIVVVAKNNYSNLYKSKNIFKLIDHYKNENSKKHLVLNQFVKCSEVQFGEIIEENNISKSALINYDESTYDNSNLDKSTIVKNVSKIFSSNKQKKSLNEFEIFLEEIL